ncbi:hypothetical protein SAMN05216567_103205 [Variovorax sp. OK605]|nr:hypothetical protein SAMN05216567_103205 [Variovorax sp. OK605]
MVDAREALLRQEGVGLDHEAAEREVHEQQRAVLRMEFAHAGARDARQLECRVGRVA